MDNQSNGPMSIKEKVLELEKIGSLIISGEIVYPLSEIENAIQKIKAYKLNVILGIFSTIFLVLNMLIGNSAIIILLGIGSSIFFGISSTRAKSKVDDILTLSRNGNLGITKIKVAPVVQLQSKAEEIKKMSQLAQEGVITEAEFNDQKKKILAS